MGYLTNGPVVEDLIEIDKLVLVVVHDETAARGNLMTRVAGYSGCSIPWGIRWGGAENSLFEKNLLLQPMAGARGQRLDTASESLLRLALQLDRDMQRHLPTDAAARVNNCSCRNSGPVFAPPMWPHVEPGGPELAEHCAKTGRSADDAMAAIQRSYFGLLLCPFAWVSSAWQQVAAVFADLRRFPLRQVFPVTTLPEDLVGFQGAAEYDFLDTRFGSVSSQSYATESALA